MSDTTQPVPGSGDAPASRPPTGWRGRLWRILTLVLLGLGIHLLAPQVAALPHLAQVLRSLAWPWLGVAVALQVASYLGTGYLLTTLTASPSGCLSLRRAVAIALASGSVGMVAGGVVGTSAAEARWLRLEGVAEEDAAMAGPLVVQLNNMAMVAAATVGLVHLLAKHQLATIQIVGFALVLATIVAGTVAIVIGRRHPERLIAAANRLVLPVARALHHPLEPEQVSTRVERILDSWSRHLGRQWHRPVAGALANLGFDMLCLLALFAAARHPVSIGVLLVGYGLPLLLGKISVLPGGVGVVEVTMTALYVGMGVPRPVLVVVVLVYRFLSFWLPALIGFGLVPFLNRRRGPA
jgi:uncharacterized protein (TIRG00374 family)